MKPVEIPKNNEQKNCNINNNRTTFALNNSKGLDDIRVIVGLDFGVTYSGFAYCHVNDDYQDIHTNDIWPMVIKGAIECRWGGIDYFEDVLLVLTIPAEYSEIDKLIIRQCVYNADLIKDRDSEKLQFTTESKATALYCAKHCETGGKFSLLIIFNLKNIQIMFIHNF
ncbi:hypothetical protein RhiirA4_440556 [Rhizophagus irregularis]|uniref:Hsp70 family protein n=1 Tax=Rhizophagus irregularis TaxID=588596 RepID=A0A2I1G0U1_9GLOM|nr:hypothetical protein RhiirA4_440556 [Rhizophagus irregularis]